MESEHDHERPSVSKIGQFLSIEILLAIVQEETEINNSLQSQGTTRQIVLTTLFSSLVKMTCIRIVILTPS